MPSDLPGSRVSMPSPPARRPFDVTLQSAMQERTELLDQVRELDEIIERIKSWDRRVRSATDDQGANEYPLPAIPATQPSPRKKLPASEYLPVRKNEFQGLRAVEALENYLRARPGIRISLKQAVEQILQGGAAWGEPRGRSADPARRAIHNLKIAFSNRSKTFAWEPKTLTRKGWPGVPKGDVDIVVWLAESAQTPKKRKRTK